MTFLTFNIESTYMHVCTYTWSVPSAAWMQQSESDIQVAIIPLWIFACRHVLTASACNWSIREEENGASSSKRTNMHAEPSQLLEPVHANMTFPIVAARRSSYQNRSIRAQIDGDAEPIIPRSRLGKSRAPSAPIQSHPRRSGTP